MVLGGPDRSSASKLRATRTSFESPGRSEQAKLEPHSEQREFPARGPPGCRRGCPVGRAQISPGFPRGIFSAHAVALGLTIPMRNPEDPEASPPARLEHDLHPTVAYAILPIFALPEAA